MCTWVCICVCPFQMNPQQDSPNSFGVFSWALLCKHSSQTWMFCGQTWLAGSSWPFDICWAPPTPREEVARAGQGSLDLRLFWAVAWHCWKPPLCHLKFGGVSQGVVHWSHFCAGRSLWWEKSMTHLERTHGELRALGPETGPWAGSCGRGWEGAEPDAGLEPGQPRVSRSLESGP